MKPIIRQILEQLFSFIGLSVTRTGTGILGLKNNPVPQGNAKSKWLQNMNIKTVIDVGAHKGESALQFRKLFPNAKIFSFEPIHDCFLELNSTMKNAPNFRSFNLALGDKEGTLDIHRSEFTPSSSLLKMAKLHREAFPFSSGESLETIDVNTLDNVAAKLDLEDNIILKIDVQGYEHKVIMGSANILKRVKIIIIETSFHELYEGQPLFSDIYELLYEQGFVYAGNWGELKSPLDGIPLQQDSIFVRR